MSDDARAHGFYYSAPLPGRRPADDADDADTATDTGTHTGSARPGSTHGDTTDGPDEAHRVPQGVDQATVDAVGKLTAALEVVEHARGMLYAFHRLTGRADNDLRDALDALEAAGHTDLARGMREDLLGRNVLSHRWTFQVVEDYDDGYWSTFRRWEQTTRDQLLEGRRHVYEAQLKEHNRTRGRSGHEARPGPEG